jgi:hypothetical protein
MDENMKIDREWHEDIIKMRLEWVAFTKGQIKWHEDSIAWQKEQLAIEEQWLEEAIKWLEEFNQREGNHAA